MAQAGRPRKHRGTLFPVLSLLTSLMKNSIMMKLVESADLRNTVKKKVKKKKNSAGTDCLACKTGGLAEFDARE